MSEHVFDAFTRLASAGMSRRGFSRALAGLAFGGIWFASLPSESADAKRGRKHRRKRRRNKKDNQAINQSPACTASCGGAVCGDDGCGGSCGTCGAGQLCAQGRCVTGQGTCPAGADVCNGFTADCGGGDHECVCWTSMANETRCGSFHPLHSGHSICTNDEQCEMLFPDVPGAFCVQDTGEGCVSEGVCYAPCPL